MYIEIGQRVLPLDGVSRLDGYSYHGFGTIVSLCGGDIGVEFDEEFGGHELNGECAYGFGLYFPESRFEDYFEFVDEPYQKKYRINRWNYRPNSFTKYGNSTINKFFGLEIEMDCGGESNLKCNEILQIINNTDEIAYAVHDGSIDDGFEIVMQPCTLNYLANNRDITEGLQKAIELGYRGDVETCGLHVHVDRGAFGATEQEQETNIAKTVYLFEKHWGELVAMSRRRTTHRIERYAKRYMYKYNVEDTLEQCMIYNKRELEYKDYDNRYFAINLQNDNTVEFRIFKGTLNYESIIAIVQFINRLVNVSTYSIGKVRSMSFYSIIAPLTKKMEFVEYLKRTIENGHFRMFPEIEGLI